MPATITTSLDIRAFLAEFQLIHGWKPDFLIVDYIDLMMLAEKWLRREVLLAEDLDRNGVVDSVDFAIFGENWSWEEWPVKNTR